MKKQANRKKQIIPESTAIKIAIMIMLIFELSFVGMLLMVDILPGKFVLITVLFLMLSSLGISVLLAAENSFISKYLGFIFALLMCMITLLGLYYLYSTNYTLNKISGITTLYEKYDVVVAKDSSNTDIDDIRDDKVYVINKQSKAYSEARGKLAAKENTGFEALKELAGLEKIICDNGLDKNRKIILLSDSNYSMLCEENVKFKEDSRVIYQIKVETKVNDTSSEIDVTEDSFNIYVSGMDVWGDINRVARSDVNMIITVNPKTRQILLTSIPRDSYVPLHMNGEMDKLTHTGVYGINETLDTVEDWTGIHSDFYVRANFTMIRDLINAIGGIRVYSDYRFSSHLKHYHYHVGWNDMSGRAALYFARERKAFKNSDEQRVINQQRVVKAIIRKSTRSEVVLTHYTDILDAISKYMQTNMSKDSMAALVKMQLNDMDTHWTINSISIGGEMDQRGTWSMGPERPLDVFITDKESVDKAVKQINMVMYPEDDKPVKIKDNKSEKDNLKATEPITYKDRNGNVIGHSDY